MEQNEMNEDKLEVFRFNIGGEPIQIKIKQIISENYGYGLHVWPSAVVLAEYISQNTDLFKEKNILELGCGVGLPGIIAAKVNAKTVIFTDKHMNVDGKNILLENCKKNCILNIDFNKVVSKTKVQFEEVTWGKFTLNMININPVPDIIIAADCFYNMEDCDDVLATLSYWMEQNPSLIFITSYQIRSHKRSIAPELEKWNLKATEIPMDDIFENTMNDTPIEEIELFCFSKDRK